MTLSLRRLDNFTGVTGPVVVCVMDGVGIGAHDEGDAVWLARTPTLDRLARGAAVTHAAHRARYGGRHAERRGHG
jgi:2,3-bisphosphoglycerate-independent phosphoglycerate mutase